jgi:hypothetical protein
MSVNFALLGLGMAVAGPITDAVGARWMFGIAAIVSAGAALLGRVMTRGIRSMGAGDEPEPLPAA